MSSKKLVSAFPVLREHHRKKIFEHAEGLGYKAVFCDDAKEALKEASDAEIVFGLDPNLADAGPDIKWICTPSAGVDHMLKALKGKDILLSNSSGAYGITISEHIIMVTLELMRRRMEYIDFVREKKWERNLPISSIYGSRVTLIGTGDIGTETAVRIRAFNPGSVTGINRSGSNPGGVFDRIATLSELESILPETDLLILSLPSTAGTRGILTEERLRMMPEGSYLVNVGRGDVLDQKAIERLLREGYLGGAALDVFEKEPIDENDTIWDCPSLLITTHVSGNWNLPSMIDKIVDMFLKDFTNYCEGKPLRNLVDLKNGY